MRLQIIGIEIVTGVITLKNLSHHRGHHAQKNSDFYSDDLESHLFGNESRLRLKIIGIEIGIQKGHHRGHHRGRHTQKIESRLFGNGLYLYASHCIILHHIVTYCNTLQHTATHGGVVFLSSDVRGFGVSRLGLNAPHCTTLQHTATHCNTLQHTATHCNTLQHTATHCNTLQRTATHCNALQHTEVSYLSHRT